VVRQVWRVHAALMLGDTDRPSCEVNQSVGGPRVAGLPT
jgi:hypothetical protein